MQHSNDNSSTNLNSQSTATKSELRIDSAMRASTSGVKVLRVTFIGVPVGFLIFITDGYGDEIYPSA